MVCVFRFAFLGLFSTLLHSIAFFTMECECICLSIPPLVFVSTRDMLSLKS
jgi:hypothetical protein